MSRTVVLPENEVLCVLVGRVDKDGHVSYCWEPMRELRNASEASTWYIVRNALELGDYR